MSVQLEYRTLFRCSTELEPHFVIIHAALDWPSFWLAAGWCRILLVSTCEDVFTHITFVCGRINEYTYRWQFTWCHTSLHSHTHTHTRERFNTVFYQFEGQQIPAYNEAKSYVGNATGHNRTFWAGKQGTSGLLSLIHKVVTACLTI